MTSRRRFIQAAIGAGTAVAGFGSLSLLQSCARTPNSGALAQTWAKGAALQPVIDPVSKRALLQLPKGFRYFSFGMAGEAIPGLEGEQAVIPPAADGMGLVQYDGATARLVRNHELWEDTGYFARPDLAYDVGSGGGTVTLDVDLQNGVLRRTEVSLCGTTANCSGGVTPWGSWLSGEEQISLLEAPISSRSGRLMSNFKKPHGFMFESGVQKDGRFAPILGMGQMRHEAAAIDFQTGFVYLTEDNDPMAGLFRFKPADVRDYHVGGQLEMLAVDARQEFRTGVPRDQRFQARWVPIADPLRPHADAQQASDGCFQQGAQQGGAIFRRLEGIYIRNREMFFTATNGGDRGIGQVFVLDLDSLTLGLVHEATEAAVFNWPDAIHAGPAGGHVVCQDGKEIFPQVLYFLGPDGTVAPIARNNVGGKFATSEWAGCSMSPDGKWLFANVYSPGFSVAITGPFEAWAQAQLSV
jgi:uncharacterized protein